MGRIYGYARVSTRDQNLEVQVNALKAAGCEKVFTDKLTGSSMNRPGFKRAMKALEKGDTLVVTKLDRLARTLKGILETGDELKACGVEFRSLGDSIDTSNAFGRAFYQLLGVFAELERALIVERTGAGRELAMDKGVKFGRKAKLTDDQLEQARDLLATGRHTIADVARSLHVHRATLYRYLARTEATAA